MRDLVARFLDEHGAKRSLSLRRNYESLFRLHLLPPLGSRKVAEIRWEDLEKIHHDLRDRPYQANRFLAACSKAWVLAARWGWFPREIPNPARGHDRYQEEWRGQALDSAALQRLGAALEQEPAGAGFQIGDQVRIAVTRGRLVITRLEPRSGTASSSLP